MLTGKQYQNNSYFIPVMSEMLLGSQEIAKIYVCQFFLPNWCFDWRGAGEIKRVILCFSSSPIDTWIFSLWLGVRWKKSLVVRQNYLEVGMPDDVFHQTFSHRYRISRLNSFEFCYHISGPNMAVKNKTNQYFNECHVFSYQEHL